MNVQQSLLQEIRLYEFKLGHNAALTPPPKKNNIYCGKDEGEVDHNSATKWLKYFLMGCKNLDHQKRSSWLKTVNSKKEFKIMKANPVKSIRRLARLACHSLVWA